MHNKLLNFGKTELIHTCHISLYIGGFDRGSCNVQCRLGGADVLEPEHQHIPGPAMGKGAGDTWRGPAFSEQICDRVREGFARDRPTGHPQGRSMLQALHRLRCR